MPSKVAVITGAASGIGLALTRSLVSKGWNVAMGDINQQAGDELASELYPAVLFKRTDVSDWDQLAALFKAAWAAWGCIDFHAANAGIDDKEPLCGPTSGGAGDEPSRPDVSTVAVDLIAVIYGLRLATHYFRKNAVPGGKIVVTGSSAGLYASPFLPQYTACKHAVNGLTRAMATPLLAEGITINAVLPAFVITNLPPALLRNAWPKKHTTPMSTIIRLFDQYLDSDVTGQIGECSLEGIYFRAQPEFSNESQRWIVEESGRLWEQGYTQPHS